MHAIVQHTLGSPEVLQWSEWPDPEPGAGQVRIRVEVAGVHRVDTMIRAGHGPGGWPTLPMVPGREVVGVVDEVGPDVDVRLHGRRVAAHLGMASGGYAELAVAPVDALHELDEAVDPAAAVAMVGTGRTAMAVLDAARLDATDRVLVLGASGGLGVLLVQAAAATAASVVGVAGAAKAPTVADLDVAVVDHGDDHWPDAVQRALAGPPTVVIDPVGGALGRRAFELLPPRTRHVLVGAASGEVTALDAGDLLARGVTAVGALGPHLARDAALARSLQARALQRLDHGRWVPLTTAFDLRGAAAAHEAIEGRATVGKVVLRA